MRPLAGKWPANVLFNLAVKSFNHRGLRLQISDCRFGFEILTIETVQSAIINLKSTIASPRYLPRHKMNTARINRYAATSRIQARFLTTQRHRRMTGLSGYALTGSPSR
jgi:hypothetical protein